MCRFGDCVNEAQRDGLCWAHLKQRERDGRLREVKTKPESPRDRLREAALAYADAADYDEDAFKRADDNLRKSAIAYARHGVVQDIREALARARARGVRLGRPRKADPAQVAELVAAVGVKQAAARLGCSVRTVKRAKRAWRQAER